MEQADIALHINPHFLHPEFERAIILVCSMLLWQVSLHWNHSALTTADIWTGHFQAINNYLF